MKTIEHDEIVKAMLKILAIPFNNRIEPERSAILILPGKYQEYRIAEGVKPWPSRAKHLWVAGTSGDPTYTREDVIPYVGEDSPHILVGGHARHTKDQMEWARGLLLDSFPEVEHVIMTTSVYHLPRCVLTFLETMCGTPKRWISISPVPLISPIGDSFSIEDLEGEIQRIETYQKKGGVASFAYLDTYLRNRPQ